MYSNPGGQLGLTGLAIAEVHIEIQKARKFGGCDR
jgi:hypothetical protein